MKNLFRWSDLLRIVTKVHRMEVKTRREVENSFNTANFTIDGLKHAIVSFTERDAGQGVPPSAHLWELYDSMSEIMFRGLEATQAYYGKEYVRDRVWVSLQKSIKRAFRYVEIEEYIKRVKQAYKLGYTSGRAKLVESLTIKITGQVIKLIEELLGKAVKTVVKGLLPKPLKALPMPKVRLLSDK